MESTGLWGGGMAGALVATVCALVTACGGATIETASSGDGVRGAAAADGASSASTTPDAAPPVTPPTGPCGGVVLGAPAVTILNVATDAPAATGGTVLPGTYDLILDAFHLGAIDAAPSTTPTALVRAETLTVTFGAYARVTSDATGVAYESGTYTDDGKQLEMRPACPAALTPAVLTYTATPDELHVFRGAGCVEELVFRRRAGL